jgi:hypothetical protein
MNGWDMVQSLSVCFTTMLLRILFDVATRNETAIN